MTMNQEKVHASFTQQRPAVINLPIGRNKKIPYPGIYVHIVGQQEMIVPVQRMREGPMEMVLNFAQLVKKFNMEAQR